MIGVLSDVTSPIHCCSAEARDDVENFAFVGGIRNRTKGKHEGTGGHEVWKFGDTSREFRRWFDSRFTELFLGTEGRVRGVGIGFEFVDATEGIPKSGSEIVVLGEGRFADTGGRFRVIIERGRRRRTMGCGSGGPLRWHCCLLMLIVRDVNKQRRERLGVGNDKIALKM